MNEYLPQQTLAKLTAPATTVLCFEDSGDTTFVNVVGEGIAGLNNNYTGSAVGDGYPVSNNNNDIASVASCQGLAYGSCTAGTGGAIPATGGSSASGTARHDPNPNQYNGGSEYLLADGHVKFLRVEKVGLDGWKPRSNDALNGNAATFNPQ